MEADVPLRVERRRVSDLYPGRHGPGKCSIGRTATNREICDSKVAPASLDGEDHPGYSLTATSYPGLDLSETMRVRTVLTFERCNRIARDFMDLFSASYDGPGSLEDALDYALRSNA